ncbi:hypothetical protein [Bdellovibrio reynosensis]|uniref:Uncharacterized protein n=1 Tax=Bdellovibrio reynosensis TaxID=2835041 RepID=A0ABY4C6Z5_9BACT|nr:hypothetical protein [Bdellovibrio reynosensis]UOF00743.1 hypothetical protein MNR06_13655 [Bdellovibrio reynosensis]
MKILIYTSSAIAAIITLGFVYWAMGGLGPKAAQASKVIVEKVYVEVPKAGRTDAPSLEGVKAQK